MSICVRNKLVSGGERIHISDIHLRNIIEQSIEWNAPLCIGFIDFKKAFDSIHQSTLWKTSEALWTTTEDSRPHQNIECSVPVEINQTNSLSVKSGVRQVCIVFPIQYSP